MWFLTAPWKYPCSSFEFLWQFLSSSLVVPWQFLSSSQEVLCSFLVLPWYFLVSHFLPQSLSVTLAVPVYSFVKKVKTIFWGSLKMKKKINIMSSLKFYICDFIKEQGTQSRLDRHNGQKDNIAKRSSKILQAGTNTTELL